MNGRFDKSFNLGLIEAGKISRMDLKYDTVLLNIVFIIMFVSSGKDSLK
jgi:hypothetical protein